MQAVGRILVATLLLAASARLSAADSGEPGAIPGDIIEKLVHRQLERSQEGVARFLQYRLDHTIEQIELSERSAVAARMGAADAASLSANSADFEALRGEVRKQFRTARSRISPQSKAQLTRIDSLSAQVEERFNRVKKAFDAIKTAKSESARRAARANARKVLKSLRRPDDAVISPLSEPNFIYRKPPPSLPEIPSIAIPRYLAQFQERSPVYAEQGAFVKVAGNPPGLPSNALAECGHVPLDLNTGPTAQAEVRASQETSDLASALDYSPIRIFNWVYENIAYEPYYGSLKGAQATLISRAGNATDQASLLVALLRASNIPARYVKGTIEVRDSAPAGQNGRVARWVGAKSYEGALAILAQGRIRGLQLALDASASPVGIRMTHVWVEACVPYAHYRGARVDTVGHRWIPLDSSFKTDAISRGWRQARPSTSTRFFTVIFKIAPTVRTVCRTRRSPNRSWCVRAPWTPTRHLPMCRIAAC